MLNNAAIGEVFQALAEPARRVIVERLSLGSASVSELAEPLDMTLAAVVQHVQSLEQSGLIRTEKVGRVRICHIEPRALTAAERWIAQRRQHWERKLDRLGEVLREAEPARRQRRKRGK